MTDVPNIEEYQLVSLSNVLDWSDVELGKTWAEQLAQLQTGAKVLIRQLNNEHDWFPYFSEHFIELDTAHFQDTEKSLFYNQHRLFQRK